jgi:hypothetical protein
VTSRPSRALAAGWLAALALLLVGPAWAGAADLASVERRIAKEPVYRAKVPEYLLLVFGPELKTRVWVVVDGDRLHVDRNANGDLTEPGEALAPSESRELGEDSELYAAQTEFTLDALTEPGGAKHTDLVIERMRLRPLTAGTPPHSLLKVMWDNHPTGWWTNFRINVGGKREHSCSPVLATRSAFAPMIHLGGPVRLALSPVDSPTPPRLRRGDLPNELTAILGTPGVGPGTFATIGYYDVPKDVNPTLEITFPARPGATPVTQKFTLDGRC